MPIVNHFTNDPTIPKRLEKKEISLKVKQIMDTHSLKANANTQAELGIYTKIFQRKSKLLIRTLRPKHAKKINENEVPMIIKAEGRFQVLKRSQLDVHKYIQDLLSNLRISCKCIGVYGVYLQLIKFFPKNLTLLKMLFSEDGKFLTNTNEANLKALLFMDRESRKISYSFDSYTYSEIYTFYLFLDHLLAVIHGYKNTVDDMQKGSLINRIGTIGNFKDIVRVNMEEEAKHVEQA